MRWVATGWNIHLLSQADRATAAHFFNKPASFGTGHRPARNPVPDGCAATPALRYAAYAQFAADIADRAITGPYPAVLYDPEDWAQANHGDPGQMAAAARSVDVDGFYVSMTSAAISHARAFFKEMLAAGY